MEEKIKLTMIKVFSKKGHYQCTLEPNQKGYLVVTISDFDLFKEGDVIGVETLTMLSYKNYRLEFFK